VNVINPAVVTDAMKDWNAVSPENRQTVSSAFPIGYVGRSNDDPRPVIVFLATDDSHYFTGHRSSSTAALRTVPV